MHHQMPQFPFVPHLREQLVGVHWDTMNEEQRINYCKHQFMLTIKDLARPSTDVSKRLERLGKLLRKPFYNSESYTDGQKSFYHGLCMEWTTKKLPQSRWMAIRALHVRYLRCERMLNKKYLDRKNEFLRVMNIRPCDKELSAEELFHQIFDETDN